MFPVAILAGGLATRLHPQAQSLPKALLNIAGRPFIFHQLDLLQHQGIEEVVVCIGHLGEQIEAAVGDGRAFGLRVRYSSDGAELLGTGGALKQALALLGENFFVLYGDSYLRCSFTDIQSAHQRLGRPALMTVLRNDNRWVRSNVLFLDGEILAYDKTYPRTGMAHVDFGVSVLAASVLRDYVAPHFDLADLYRELCARRELAAFEVGERFYEIGSPEGIAETEAFLTRGSRPP
jgi:N-acetyl-alpha-D-muramate 1-phosphate uridylyltransferase